MEKINFINGTSPALNATNLNKMQENVENEIKPIQKKIEGINKIQTVIPIGQHFQIPFKFFCGFASFRVYGSNYEYFKIYTVMLSNKYASEIQEFNSFAFENNPNCSVLFEIIDGEGEDISKYIRITNTGNINVHLLVGVLNTL